MIQVTNNPTVAVMSEATAELRKHDVQRLARDGVRLQCIEGIAAGLIYLCDDAQAADWKAKGRRP